MLSRYVIVEMMKPTLVVLGILVVLFAAYSWVSVLASAANALLPLEMLWTLIGYKIAIALEVLLPVSLYLGIILGFGRLYSDSEVKAMMACGISPYRIIAIVLVPACVMAIVVAAFSLYLRPWAYLQSYQLKAEAESGFQISNLDPGHFYERRDGSLVFYAEETDPKRHRLRGIFVQSETEDTLRVISAKEADEQFDSNYGTPLPILFNGHEYKISKEGTIKHISSFTRLAIYPEKVTAEYKRKAAFTDALIHSDSVKDIAEVHWRFSTPFSTIFLALLALPLSRAAPRQGKYAKLFTASVMFAVYYFSGLLVKTLVEQHDIPIFPGLWLVVGLLGVMACTLLLGPTRFTKNL